MQGAAAPVAPAASPPAADIKTEVITEAKTEDMETERRSKRAGSPAPPPAPRPRLECPRCRLTCDSADALELHRFTAHGDERRPRHQCARCTRDFPCAEALDVHRNSCSPLKVVTPERDRRESFFAKLDLRNRSFGIPGALTPPMERFTPKYEDSPYQENGMRHMEGRDLADIQSILNVTSAGSILERLTATKVPLDGSVLTPPDTVNKERDQEETQDSFAAEFRRMKLRGEFPCRLCPAKFPNLRALKGHNRVHLSGTGPGPYRCNMCPHASLDKAALVRHMRTHNGDRPYECAVCNYAFTTKANCERHLRNRHAKVTREDVKRSIIYHPSEDPNNDEINSKMSREDVKRSLAFHTPEVIERREETPLSLYSPSFERRAPSLTPVPLDSPARDEPVAPRIKVKGIGQLTQIPDFRPQEMSMKSVSSIADEDMDSYDSDGPVDLSTNNDENDVLDLSKKRRDDERAPTPPRPHYEPDAAALAASAFEKTRFLLAQQRLLDNQIPKIDPAYYATQLSQIYAGGVPGLPGLPLPPSFPINPYFLPSSFFPHPSDTPEISEIKQRIQKEIIRSLNMSGGGIVGDKGQPKLEPDDEDSKAAREPSPPPALSPAPSAQSQTDSVKMVIKNGVLMPKQKQRRYRTERPFSCSQCSARFTLRSNMERHVKQQHPAHWSVRRPTPRAPPPYPPSETLAGRLKFAMLARQLEAERSPARRDSDEVADNEEDEDDALVIDEEDAEPRAEPPERAARSERPERPEHPAAHRAAAEILLATRHQELNKDFDLKIAGSLISKPLSLTKADEEPAPSPPAPPALPPAPPALPPAPPALPGRSDEEEDEEGLVASTSEGHTSGSDENKSESDGTQPPKKKSAYSLAPNRVSCPYCHRKFPWSSSLRRHVLTHTGQKPFKCPHCPLLFTTKSNCDRHLLRKHGGSARAILAEPQPETFKCTSCPTTFSCAETLKKHASSHESPSEDEVVEGGLTYKCHLCEASFGERSAALGHLQSSHAAEYGQLVGKGALDAPSDRSESADDEERGKFPDHANRKVVCAFCNRRFWSAEDLRRHMRTHSGERPYACELCRRRFTLKHSMLRHRKKHREETDEEDVSPPRTPRPANGYGYDDDELPSNVNNNNSPPYEKRVLRLTRHDPADPADPPSDPRADPPGDLIGKLLGIPDSTLINKLLTSPDVAAKLLGVNK